MLEFEFFGDIDVGEGVWSVHFVSEEENGHVSAFDAFCFDEQLELVPDDCEPNVVGSVDHKDERPCFLVEALPEVSVFRSARHIVAGEVDLFNGKFLFRKRS